MGRVYSNVDRKFYSSAAWDEKALAVRVAVPLEAIPKSLARISRAFDWWTGREVPLRTKSAQGEDWTMAEVDLAGGDCAVVEFVVEDGR